MSLYKILLTIINKLKLLADKTSQIDKNLGDTKTSLIRQRIDNIPKTSNIPSTSQAILYYWPALKMCHFVGYITPRKSLNYVALDSQGDPKFYDLWKIPKEYLPNFYSALSLYSGSSSAAEVRVNNNGTITLKVKKGASNFIDHSWAIAISGTWLVN